MKVYWRLFQLLQLTCFKRDYDSHSSLVEITNFQQRRVFQ